MPHQDAIRPTITHEHLEQAECHLHVETSKSGTCRCMSGSRFFSRFPALLSILASSTASSTATDLSVAFNLSNRPNFMYMF